MKFSGQALCAIMIILRSQIAAGFFQKHIIHRNNHQQPLQAERCQSIRKVHVWHQRMQSTRAPFLHGRHDTYLYARAATTILKSTKASTGVSSDAAASKKGTTTSKISRIVAIRSKNLGGAQGRGDEIELRFDMRNTEDRGTRNAAKEADSSSSLTSMVAVTGETGSGKSLLVSKAADLITGGKVAASLLPTNTDSDSNNPIEASVEIELELYQPHLEFTRSCLKDAGLDAAAIIGSGKTKATLTLKRTLIAQASVVRSTTSKTRVKSLCEINGRSVTLKAMKAISTPLLALVDAPAASTALGKPKARMAMIDTAVPSEVLVWTSRLKVEHGKARKERKAIERELTSRTLPISMVSSSDGIDERDMELLLHWVEELDAFETRVSNFCGSLASEYWDGSQSSLLTATLNLLGTISWMDSTDDDLGEAAFSSAIYKALLDVSDGLKVLDDQVFAAEQAYETLASLSSATSAQTQIEKTRNFLVDATGYDDVGPSESSENKVQVAAEKSHDLLNQVEDALSTCARFMDDDIKGLLAVLHAERKACPLTSEDVNGMISEWSTLARKHGISPYLLPACHATLRQELDGNVNARTLLPQAIEKEKKALQELEEASALLSKARQNISRRLSESITRRMPRLGMDGSSFEARIDPNFQPCSSTSGILGGDGIDFIIQHGQSSDGSSAKGGDRTNSRGGKIDLVASSGEKARILLAIECEIPGSVGALCGSSTTGIRNQEVDDGSNETVGPSVPPVAVIYDEIDAHVGGRAAVSLADMLSDQSRACQVISITHSPSVAAVADIHIVIQKQQLQVNANGGANGSAQQQPTLTEANNVDGTSRREELARMASGDLASEEAQAFADALIRHGKATRQRKQSTN